MKKNYFLTLISGLLLSVYSGYGQFPAPYCQINEDFEDVEEITTITFEGLSFTNQNTTDVLVDLTSVFVNVQQGGTYSIALEGNTYDDYINAFVVFVDWNQNGVLDDEGEIYEVGTIFDSTGFDGINANTTITVPEDAVVGSTRARIIKTYIEPDYDYILNIDPCYISMMDVYQGASDILGSYGQAIDITVNVAPADQTVEPVTYCNIDEDYLFVEEITSVVFEDASITNTNATDIYVDFTSTIANIYQGGSHEIIVEGNTYGNFENEFVAFIDWNKNGILDDEGEVYYIGMITNSDGEDNVTASAFIEVPESAELGETRIRITKTYSDTEGGELLNIDPCYISSYLEEYDVIFGSFGQALDFTVNVSAAANIRNADNNAFAIYPNPTENILNISGKSSVNEVVIYNIQGQRIFQVKGSEIAAVDVSDIASGQYIIQIIADDATQTSKFIKK
jgi:hypothetical protein